ncbi:MAG: DNA polymerase III subunit delta [Chitinophagaceae bacterium]
MSTEKIINDWRKNSFQPVYWLEGEEEYFIDKAVMYAEKQLLNESERDFNLSIYYGKDTGWNEVVNTCQQHPMFGNRKVVILKEAQQMREIDNLASYIEKPLTTTLFIVAYKGKKLDARTKFAKLVKDKAVLISTKKLRDDKIPDWTMSLLEAKGLTITPKGLALLNDHVGSNLTRIENEINKITLNLADKKKITESDIENYTGVSKDFNVFELQRALADKDLAKCIRIIQYFDANPKAGPIQMVLPTLYVFFSKVYMVFGAETAQPKAIASAIGVSPFFVDDYVKAARLYTFEGVENALLLLHQYNLKSIGIGNVNTSSADLLKEMVVKIIA